MPLDTNIGPRTADAGNVLSRPINLRLGANKVSLRARMVFTERLALLLETGTPLHPSLEALQKQTDHPKLQTILADLIDHVASGQSFSQALGRHPEVFSSTYVNLIAASESGGFMHKVLKQLLDMDQKRVELNSTLAMAATYPAFLTVFATAVVVFVLTWVFPRFAKMFESIGDRLPVTTKVLMAASDFLIGYWPFLIAVLVGGTVAGARWVNTTGGRTTIDRWKLGLPVLRNLFMSLYLIRTLRVLSLSLANGVSIMDALGSCRELVPNLRFRAFLREVEETVQDGKGIAAGFNKPEYIPPIAIQMIQTGEASGNLGLVMGRIADDMEAVLTKRVNILAKAAEPVLLLTMGLVVGVIVSALILPIFKLSGTVH